MALPTECKMPDLSGIESPLMGRLIVQFMVGEPNISKNVSSYRKNFIRLVDKAVREYNEARKQLLLQVAEPKRPVKEMKRTGRYIYIFEFTDYIENCINAISRLFQILVRIYSEKDSPVLPRDLRKLLNTKNAIITNIRNSVEHIDEQIQRGECPAGKPIMLAFNNDSDGIAISKYEIKFQDLATVLKSMNEVGLYLLTSKTASTETT